MSVWTPTDDPFPHTVVDGHWDPTLLDAVAAEFPHPDDSRWRRYSNAQEGKYEGPEPMWGPATGRLYDKVRALTGFLSDGFAIPDLTMETIGGGYHLIPPGGHLDIHTDFSRSPETGLYRRLNCLIYLNWNWTDPGGRLELWPDGDNDPTVIAPEHNRTVVFATSARSWHGHPHPAGRWRMSVAAYFFAPTPPPGFVEQSTVWR